MSKRNRPSEYLLFFLHSLLLLHYVIFEVHNVIYYKLKVQVDEYYKTNFLVVPSSLIWDERLAANINFYFKRRGAFKIKHNSKNQDSMGQVFSDRCVNIRVIYNFLLLWLRCKLIPLKPRYWFLAISFFI